MKKLLIALAASPLFLMGCASGPTEGTVVDKYFSQGMSTMNCVPNGAGGQTCFPTKYPDCWRVVIEDEYGDTGSKCVRQWQFEDIRVGDYVDFKDL